MITSATMLKTVSIHALHEQLETDPQSVLIDVRTPAEYAAGHVAMAQNIPLGTMPLAQIGAEWGREAEGKPIYIICQSGRRSQRFVEDLAQTGFQGALCVAGGTIAWQAAGLPLKRNVARKPGVAVKRRALIVGGLAAIAGGVLGLAVHPAFIAVPITLGLLQLAEGLTGRCVLTGLLRPASDDR